MAKHALIYFVAFALPGLLGFFSFGVYTHLLVPAQYAIYSVGASVAFLVGNVCYGWIRFSIGRYQSEAPEKNFVPFALLCFGVTTTVLGPSVLIVAMMYVDLPPIAIAAVLSMTVAQALFDILQETLRSQRLSFAFTRASITRSLLAFCISIPAAFYFRAGAAILFAIASAFLAVALWLIVVNKRTLHREPLGIGLVGRFLRYGMPLAISGLVFSGNATLARILVGAALGAESAGRFGAALDVTSQLSGMLAGSVCSIMGPSAIAAFRREGVKGARRELTTGVILFLALLIPMTVGLVITAKPFADLVSGPDFEDVIGRLIPLLAVSRGLNVFAQFYLHLGFQIVEKPMRQVICGTVTLAANVILNLLLTRHYGLDGAVWAMVLADLCGVLVSFFLLAPVFPIPMPMRSIVKIVGCAVGMAIACVAVQTVAGGTPLKVLLFTVATGVVTYGMAAFAADIAGVRSRAMISRGYRAFFNRVR